MKLGKGFPKKLSLTQVVYVCVIVIVLAIAIRVGILDKASKVAIYTSSLLTNSIDIAELSTAEFKYRGIAEIYEDEARTRMRCRACYNAIVKAGVNIDDIHVNVDSIQKTISVVLPEIKLNVTIIDEQEMAMLPSNADVSIDQMLRFSKEDAETEAMQSEDLINTARENLKAAIEGILYPVVKTQGYSIIWK